MKQIKISKAGMLTNEKTFRYDINTLRLMINDYNKEDNIFISDDTIIYSINSVITTIMTRHSVSFTTIAEVLRVTFSTLKAICGKYYALSRLMKPQSLLEDRQHYARNIIDKHTTVIIVAEQTGYGLSTVGRWVTDYKRFGNRMTNQSVAFRRSL
jgi:hypothetical protein